MKPFLKIFLILCFSLSLSGCGEWDDLVDSISGSDDDDDIATTQTNLPRKDVSTPTTTTDTKTETKTETKTSSDTEKTTTSEYTRKSTYTSYGVRNGGRQAWRIPKKGPDYGKKIKFVFSNGYTVIVTNTSRNYRQSNGFVFKPGIGPYGEGENNTWTAHGGIYLHAPYGNASKQVTLHH
ncbi:hypothetical protein JWG42_12875 [Desulfoprunum benzoelyticum]|uniref:YkuD domain-containing protein n=1 Tax=Desulfoprunum benzoelyticum TaxID=1506996 RepID=A0A840V647_9BACT|nr:hypothetical protein [Desulfoprunum benzoelyticum]MBB5349380.1 hypothetical protein [Desulfoprunum benzoelyticum]MBM9531046.1 hypothetical protein [Desulfoprunum benzoelyticum]